MDALIERMNMLDISIDELSESSLVSKDIIEGLCNGTLSWNEIHDIDRNFISHVLFCDTSYFENSEVRNKDIINNSFNRGESSPHVNKIKGQIQRLANDYIYLKQLNSEISEIFEDKNIG